MKFLFRSVLFLALFAAFAANASALEIISARWGRGHRWADVRDAVARQLARGHRSFEASNDVLGIDPAKGDEKFLEVVYADRTGRTYTERVKEGDKFRFRVEEDFAPGPGPGPVPPIVDERFGGGPRGGPRFEDEGRGGVGVASGTVRIVNNYPHPVQIFTIGASGEQRFVASLSPGDRITPQVRPRPGRRWIVTTQDGVRLRSFTTGLGAEQIVLR